VRNGFDINGVEENYSDALHAAVYGGHEVVVRFFIDKGVNVNGKPWQDTYCDALLSAVNRGHEGIARLLIGAAAKTDNVFTAYNAALQGNLVAVRWFVENGVDIHAKGGVCDTALQASIEARSLDVVRFLIDNGANLRAKGGPNSHELRTAALESDEAFCLFLRQRCLEFCVGPLSWSWRR
jgi:ankyrin repeat protein